MRRQLVLPESNVVVYEITQEPVAAAVSGIANAERPAPVRMLGPIERQMQAVVVPRVEHNLTLVVLPVEHTRSRWVGGPRVEQKFGIQAHFLAVNVSELVQIKYTDGRAQRFGF